MLTGTLSGSRKITVADGAEIVLKDANITSLSNSAEYAGITPFGDAAIFLEGTNTVKGGNENYPGIYAPVNHTLTIGGDGSLDASSNGWACGIGGGGNGQGAGCGDIFISASANVTVDKGIEAPNDIGAGEEGTCGTVTIEDGANIIYK